MGTILTLPEASKRAAVAETTIRRWLNSGRLKGAKTSDGKWSIESDELTRFLITESHRQPSTMEPPHGGGSDTPASMVEALRLASTALDRERAMNDDLRAENKELRSEVRALQSEIKAILVGELGNFPSRWVRTSSSSSLHHGGSMVPPQNVDPRIGAVFEGSPETHQGGVSTLVGKVESSQPSDFARRVLLLRRQGKSDKEISKEVGTNIPAVRAVLKRWESDYYK